MKVAHTQMSVVVEPRDSCFIAGTLVHTNKGLVPIEKINVGDMVLSQPETGGEIFYKRVLNTFSIDDKEVWVVKYTTADEHNPTHEDAVLHLYVTANHPFWVDRFGWIAAKDLKESQRFRLAEGGTAMAVQVWPVIRTPLPGVGWVSADTLGNWDGLERAHIVDFRNHRTLWQYPMWRREDAGVPYREQFCFDEIEGLFGSAAMADVFYGEDRNYKTLVYNLAVADFHTYYVGEAGVWVHNSCSSTGEDMMPNPAVNLAPFGRWTLRDKAAQRRLP